MYIKHTSRMLNIDVHSKNVGNVWLVVRSRTLHTLTLSGSLLLLPFVRSICRHCCWFGLNLLNSRWARPLAHARTHAHSVKQRNDLLCAATCKSIKVLTLFLFTFRFDIGIVVVAIHDCANIYILFVLIAVLLTSFLSLCVRFSVCSFQIAIFPIEHIHELGRSYVWDVCLSGRASEWTNKHMCKDKRCWARAI